ncbi:uncharacterized protein LOC135214213 [Macrobrachium nipponense]|uniref:uncharacterized protein LOC135214213 n=1 Tax=Macrobrachium nipponense TaxID=159736 RepID=UPI0030C87F7E
MAKRLSYTKEDVREEPPWCLLYADDIVLVAENTEELEGKLERWRYILESRGLSRKKTQYMTTELNDDQQTTIKLGGRNIIRVHKFKYLRSVIDNQGNMEEEINNRIQCGWNNWMKVSGVICDRKVPIRLKGRVHKAVAIPAMTYRLEASPLKKTEGRKLNVNEMRMLRWMSGVTKKDRSKNVARNGPLSFCSSKWTRILIRFITSSLVTAPGSSRIILEAKDSVETADRDGYPPPHLRPLQKKTEVTSSANGE